MKKLFKKVDKKILISILTMIIMLSTFLMCRIYAETITEEMISTGTGMANGNEGAKGSLYLEDLYNRYDIFCCSEGTLLPSVKAIGRTEYTVKSVNEATPMEAYILAEMINNEIGFTTSDLVFEDDGNGYKIEFTETERLDLANSMTFDDKIIYIILPEQKVDESGNVIEEEAGTGSEKLVMQDEDGKYYYVTAGSNSGYGVYSYVQRAWWNTEAGSKGNEIPPNELSTEAEQFEAYMNQLGVADSVEKTIVDENGNSKTVLAPDIQYTPDFNEKNTTVAWNDDEQVYLVGPFSINYVEASSTTTGRDPVMFAGIDNVELYTDASEEAMTLGNGWSFHWVNRDDSDASQYPHTGEEFYIKLNYQDSLTRITNIKFKFKYMNAAGKYEELEGKRYIEYEDGTVERVAQALAGGLIGARWYEETELNWDNDIPNQGRVKIIKNLVDEEGNLITSLNENRYFTFKVTVGSETELIRVKAGSAVMSKTYTWEADEDAPTYKVEEVLEDGYELVELKNAEGKLENELQHGPTEVLAVNKITNKGSLRIVKKIKEASTQDQEFAIVVKVSGTFKYEGVSYKEKTLTIPVKIRITAGEKSSAFVLKDFIWNEGDAPKYSVTEDEKHNTDYALKSINPKKGTLKSDREATVTVINERTEEKVKLHIIKELENANLYTDEYIESLVFKFKINVDGYGTNQIKLKPVRKDNKYVWSYLSDYYYMEEGEVLNYTIEEFDLPEGTEFVNAYSENTDAVVSGTKISGTLEDADGDFKVTNTFINKLEDEGSNSRRGKIKITKVINSETLDNTDFVFKVSVTGTFKYKGTSYKNETLEIYPINVRVHEGATEGATVLEDEFVWYGTAPTYKVEEIMNGLDGVQSTINPGEGKLKKGTTIDIIAENRTSTSHKGTLHIIKTLENANNFSNEYIQSLVFKFKINVGGRDYGTVSLEPKKVNNTYIWEHTSDYTWSAEDEAPTYTIEEVELPKGTEFVSATSSNGSSSGKSVTGTLKPDSEEDYVIENKFINKATTIVEDSSGYLIINKKVTDTSLNGKSFKFNAKITGTFEYNGTSYNNETLELNDIEVTGGSSKTLGVFKWFGTNAPTYQVEEQACSFATLKSVINNTGTLIAGGEANAQAATFTNGVDEKKDRAGGTIQITKKLEDGATSNQEFFFDIEVEGYEKFTVGVKAGQTYRSERFEWDLGSEPLKYTVTELDSENASFVSISNGTETSSSKSVSGTLSENAIVNVVCINKLQAHAGKLKVTKNVIVDEKLQSSAIDGEFTINVVINGSFEMNGESVVDSTRTITEVLRAGESFETPEIKWYGETAPTYTVTESSIPEGWTLEGISNANGQLFADTTTESIVTNALRTRVELDLTMEMAGHVWEDTRVENKEVEQVQNFGIQGIYDDQIEKGIDGVEVYIYKVIYDANQKEIYRELGKAYEDNSNVQITFPIYTTNGGYWSSPRMSVPVVTAEEKASGYTAAYDVEFVYDGQTYEPTTFLKTSEGDPNAYRAATTSKRDAWAKDSMALDYNRAEVNSRIAQVAGESEINGEGVTVGKAIGSDGNETSIYYQAVDYTEGLSSSRKVSQLQTKDSEGNIYDIYKTIARTSIGGLTYPFDSKYHLESIDKYIDESGVVERYKYTATYNYTLNINLGLLKREEADVGTTKDLYSAKVIVNGKVLNYKFNTLADLTGTTISRQLQADEMNINYELGLYNTDYYYRAELYQTDGAIYDRIEEFYKSIGQDVNETELEVYLTYKIKVYNESPNYILGINSINDYFDSSFGKPVTEVETKYIQTVDGVTVESMTEVAHPSYVETSSGNKFHVNWQITDTNIEGSDKVAYNKMVANFATNDIHLTSGEKAEITVTFKVQKDTINGVKDAIILGQKANLAEVANYSTYYKDGSIAGKIDRNSAPANTNIEEYNDRSWYEDDTDSAPILNLIISAEERKIDGIAWEDKQDTVLEHNQKVGNGVYDEGEALIGGLTTELIEKVMVKNIGSETEYTEYDFLWPTNRPMDILGGRTMQTITGFDSTIETSRTQAIDTDPEGLNLGEYRFEGVPAGNYVVRFLYGNDKTKLEDSEGITSDATAYKLDASGNVVLYSENEAILTANYDQDLEGKTPSVYSGHDYKTTTYQTGIANTGTNGYLNNEWHDLNIESRLSDARDNESRRLETIAKSTTITNVNGEILATANNKDGDHTELYKDYYMFADTAKLNVTLEDLKQNIPVDGESLINSNIPSGIEVKFVKGTIFKDGIIQTNTFTYLIKNMDIGLEERAETNIVLDKQVSSIKLITSDGRKIFDAIYDISYEELSGAEYALGQYTKILERDGKFLVAKVSLNPNSVGTDVLQAINKVENKDKLEGTQNFRFINVDETILQGCTIEINYQLTALNVSETDRADIKLEELKQIEEVEPDGTIKKTTIATQLLKAAEEIAKNNASYTKPAGTTIFNNTIQIGTYLGTTYYQGQNADGKDAIVTTTVRQLIDYVDNEAVFSASYNNGVDSSWRNVNINEITGNGIEANRLINKDIIKENNIKDKSGVFYITSQKNNLIVSVDSVQDTNTLTNKGFEVKLLPYDADNTNYSSKITLKTTRTVAAETDSNSLAFDNLAEIIKYDIPTGRRDVTTVPGNANPKKGEFETAVQERDSSATELVTLIPPTGSETEAILIIQVLAISLVALTIIVIGIIVIKKKVLVK